jgi:hypothetical protein
LKSNSFFPVVFAICFPFAFIATRYMEDEHYVGNIGLGSAVLVAGTIAAIVAGLVSVTCLLISRRCSRPSDTP